MSYDLYYLIKKLRDKLKCDVLHNKSDIEISENELSYIRKGIKSLKESKILTKNYLFFLNNKLDYESIFYYFTESFEDVGQTLDLIISEFDELLIFLKDSNYEITIKKIQPSYLISNYSHLVSKYMNDLDDYYEAKDLANITTTSSSLLTTVFKHICDEHGISYKKNVNFNTLYKNVAKKLNFLDSQYKDIYENYKTKDFRDFSNALKEISIKINQLRNLYSSSHGLTYEKILEFNQIADHHLKMVVDITKTVCNFIIGSNEFYKNKNPF